MKIAIIDSTFALPGTTYPSSQTWAEKFDLYWRDLLGRIEFYHFGNGWEKSKSVPKKGPVEDHGHLVLDAITSLIDDEISYTIDFYGLQGDNTDQQIIEALRDISESSEPSIVNLSMGVPKIIKDRGRFIKVAKPSWLSVYNEALDSCKAANIDVVIAGGNFYQDGYGGESGNWMCENDKSCIAVSAHTPEGTHASFSGTDSNIDISCVGTGLSLVGRYALKRVDGTSFAAPQVAAILAIARTKLGDFDANEVLKKLANPPTSSTGTLPNEQSDQIFGIGSISQIVAWYRFRSQRIQLRNEIFSPYSATTAISPF